MRGVRTTRRSILLPMRQGQQIGEEPEGARHTGRKLSEEAQAGVDVGALSHRGDEKAARQRRFSRIVGLEHGAIVRIPAPSEVETSFLNPALPIPRAETVG